MSEYWVYKCTKWRRIPWILWCIDAFHQKIDVCLRRWTLSLAQMAQEEISRALKSNGAQCRKTQQQLGKAARIVRILPSAILFQSDVNLLTKWLHVCRHLKTLRIWKYSARHWKHEHLHTASNSKLIKGTVPIFTNSYKMHKQYPPEHEDPLVL